MNIKIKKIIFGIITVIYILCGIVTFLPQNASAATFECSNGDTTFLGLRPWYYGLCGQDLSSSDAISKWVWTIVLNIASMVLGVVGYLAIGFVIYGGYLYLLSNGDPGKVAKGKQTITNALIGLVVCMMASNIAGAIGDVSTAVVGSADMGAAFSTLANTCYVWAGIICVVVIVVAGVTYTISNGDPGKIAKSKKAILYAGIGLAIILFAAVITNFVYTSV